MITKLIKLRTKKPKIDYKMNSEQRFLLMPVGDIHFGSEGFPKEKFIEDLRWATDRGAYLLGMGDYFDHPPESQRKLLLPLRDQTKELLENEALNQVEELADLIEFTRGHWLGGIEGNHRMEFRDGQTSDQKLFQRLGGDFFGTSTLIRLVFRETHPEGDTLIFAHHGIGGGVTLGGQLNKPEQMLKFMSADIILMGHTHAKLVGTVDRLCLTPDGKFYHRTTMVARTGAFLKAYLDKEPLPLDEPAYLSRGTYVEDKAMMPSSLGAICFSLGAEKIKDSIYWRPIIHYSV